MNTERTDFHAVNDYGATLKTFDTFDRAKAYVEHKATSFPGLHVERVTYSEARVEMFRPVLEDAS